METIFITIGLSLVFIFFLNLVNANFLRERQILKQFTNPPSWSEEEAKRLHNAWHKWKFFLMAFFAGVVAVIIYLYTTETLPAVLSGLLSGATMWVVGDMILNKLMKWDWFERGDKSGMDIIPFWVRGLLMAGLMVFLFTACETNTPIKGTNIDFIEQSKSVRMPKYSHVLIPELEKQVIVNDIWEGFEIAWKESEAAQGIYVDKGTIITFEVRKLNGVLIDER